MRACACAFDGIRARQDFILFADDATFHKLKQTSDRVYSLLFRSTGVRTFYWPQELSSANDEANCAKVNKIINDER